MEKIEYSLINKVEFLKEQKKRDEIFKVISENISLKSYNDKCVQDKVSELFEWMNRSYGCTIDMFKGLAELYETNESFSSMLISNYGQGMPKYLADAMMYFCNNK